MVLIPDNKKKTHPIVEAHIIDAWLRIPLQKLLGLIFSWSISQVWVCINKSFRNKQRKKRKIGHVGS